MVTSSTLLGFLILNIHYISWLIDIQCDKEWVNQVGLSRHAPQPHITDITNPHLKQQTSANICSRKTEVLAIVVVMDFHRISRQQWCKQIHLKPADSTLTRDMWNYRSWLVVSQEWRVKFHMGVPLKCRETSYPDCFGWSWWCQSPMYFYLTPRKTSAWLHELTASTLGVALHIQGLPTERWDGCVSQFTAPLLQLALFTHVISNQAFLLVTNFQGP